MNKKMVVNFVPTMYPDLDPSDESLAEFKDQCEKFVYIDNLPDNIQ